MVTEPCPDFNHNANGTPPNGATSAEIPAHLITALLQHDDAFVSEQLPHFLRTKLGVHASIFWQPAVLSRVIALSDEHLTSLVRILSRPDALGLSLLFDPRLMQRFAVLDTGYLWSTFLPFARCNVGFKEAERVWLQMVAKAGQDIPETTVAFAEAVLSYADLQAYESPPRVAYLDWLHEKSLVMVYGPRGVGKTMALLGLAISLTTGQPFLKWPVYHPTGVLYVEGEMPVDELRERAKLMVGSQTPTWLQFLPSEVVHSRLDRDLTLSTAHARQQIEDLLAAHPAWRVLILDNISCLFPGINEDKKQDWEPINAWLIRLRHQGKTVVLGHHAGKTGRQRGTSGHEDALTTTIALNFPQGYNPEEGCHFTLSFEKSRSTKGRVVEALDVRFDETAQGWTYQALEVNRTEQIKLMLSDGMPPRLIAEELGVIPSYVYRLKRNLGL